VFELTAILASILFVLVFTISQGLNEVVNNISEDNLYIKTILVDTFYEKSNGISIRSVFSSTDVQILASNEGVNSVYLRYSVESDEMNIYIDEQTIGIRGQIAGVDETYSIFSETYRHYVFENYQFYDNPIISGESLSPHNPFSAILDENFVYKLGYTDVNEIIGATFSISNGTKRVDNITIVGVFDYRYGTNPGLNLSGQGDSLDSLRIYGTLCPFVVTHDVVQSLSSELDETNGQQYLLVYANSIKDVEPLYRNIYSNFENDISCSLKESQEIVYTISNVSLLVLLISSIVFIVSILSIITGLFSKIYTQRGFIRMMSIMGYTTKDILVVYLYEHIITLLKLDFAITFFSYSVTIINEYLMKPFYQVVSSGLSNVFIINISDLLLYCLLFNSISVILVFLTLVIEIKSYMFRRGS